MTREQWTFVVLIVMVVGASVLIALGKTEPGLGMLSTAAAVLVKSPLGGNDGTP